MTQQKKFTLIHDYFFRIIDGLGAQRAGDLPSGPQQVSAEVLKAAQAEGVAALQGDGGFVDVKTDAAGQVFETRQRQSGWKRKTKFYAIR